MKLTILGSGTCVPSLKRQAPGFVVKIGKDLLLLDSGEGTKRRLMEAGIHPNNIDYILYTHTHVDHVVELPALLWGYMYAPKPRKKNLVIIGPKGFKRFFRQIIKLFSPLFYKESKFKTIIREVGNSKIKGNGWQILSKPMCKPGNTFLPRSIAYRLETDGKSLVYTGDMDYDYPKSLIKLAHKTDLLLIESAKPDQEQIFDHLTPSRAGEIATLACVKKLVLTHFYPPCEKYDIKKQAQKTYKGPIILARDLMEIEI